MIRELCKKLGIKTSEVGYAGMKDKNALTEQFISLPARFSKLDEIKLSNASLRFLKLGPRIRLGDLAGNEFEVRLRLRCSVKQARKRLKRLELEMNRKLIPNYFGLQRFGRNLENHVIGYLIAKGFISPRMDKSILKLYLHSLQAFLFNRALSSYIATRDKPFLREVKLIGFNTRLGSGIFDRMYRQILRSINLKCYELHVPWLRITAREARRKAFIRPLWMRWSIEGKSLNLRFALPAGSYATVLLNELFIGFDDRYVRLTS